VLGVVVGRYGRGHREKTGDRRTRSKVYRSGVRAANAAPITATKKGRAGSGGWSRYNGVSCRVFFALRKRREWRAWTRMRSHNGWAV
jgi:hypothetical protein